MSNLQGLYRQRVASWKRRNIFRHGNWKEDHDGGSRLISEPLISCKRTRWVATISSNLDDLAGATLGEFFFSSHHSSARLVIYALIFFFLAGFGSWRLFILPPSLLPLTKKSIFLSTFPIDFNFFGFWVLGFVDVSFTMTKVLCRVNLFSSMFPYVWWNAYKKD